MPTLIFNSCIEDLVRGNIRFDQDIFKLLLVTAAYTPNKDTHTRRSDVTNEVTGTSYSAGGRVITATVALDTSTDRLNISFGSAQWTGSAITARGGVVYKSHGGAANADELVMYVDFGENISSASGTFSVSFSSPIRFQN